MAGEEGRGGAPAPASEQRHDVQPGCRGVVQAEAAQPPDQGTIGGVSVTWAVRNGRIMAQLRPGLFAKIVCGPDQEIAGMIERLLVELNWRPNRDHQPGADRLRDTLVEHAVAHASKEELERMATFPSAAPANWPETSKRDLPAREGVGRE